MVMIAGLTQFNVSLFHLYNHAFFKALLFLSAGSIIHALSNEQDMRKMGGLTQRLPFLYTVMMAASLALMGIPFLTGFYSKDVILEAAFTSGNTTALFAYWLGVVTAVLTAFYSFRLVYLTFWVRTSATKDSIAHQHPMTNIELLGLSVLAVASIFIGFASRDFFNGVGTDYFGNTIAASPATFLMEMETLDSSVKLLPFIGSTAGAAAALVLLYQSNWLTMWMTKLGVFKFLANKWYFNMLQNLTVSRYVLLSGYANIWLLDSYLLEQWGAWTPVAFLQKQTVTRGAYHHDNYVAQLRSSVPVNAHFAARFYTWSIWQWVRGSSLPLMPTPSTVMNFMRSQIVYTKLSIWSSNLVWRALNTGYIPNMLASMLYLILLGCGLMYLVG